ncbi:MAG: hypothetical protein AAGB46_07395 [Verrucomicrobiota bacterium]
MEGFGLLIVIVVLGIAIYPVIAFPVGLFTIKKKKTLIVSTLLMYLGIWAQCLVVAGLRAYGEAWSGRDGKENIPWGYHHICLIALIVFVSIRVPFVRKYEYLFGVENVS